MQAGEVALLSSHAGRSGAPDRRQNTQQATPKVGTDVENQPATHHQAWHRNETGGPLRAVVWEWFVLLGGFDCVEDYLGDFLANRVVGT